MKKIQFCSSIPLQFSKVEHVWWSDFSFYLCFRQIHPAWGEWAFLIDLFTHDHVQALEACCDCSSCMSKGRSWWHLPLTNFFYFSIWILLGIIVANGLDQFLRVLKMASHSLFHSFHMWYKRLILKASLKFCTSNTVSQLVLYNCPFTETYIEPN